MCIHLGTRAEKTLPLPCRKSRRLPAARIFNPTPRNALFYVPTTRHPIYPPPRRRSTGSRQLWSRSMSFEQTGLCGCQAQKPLVGLNLGSGLFVFYLVDAICPSCKMEKSNRNQTNCFFTFVTSIHPASTPAGKYFYLYFRSWIQLALFNIYVHNILHINFIEQIQAVEPTPARGGGRACPRHRPCLEPVFG